MSAIDELVSFATGLRYEDLPEEAVTVVKRSILNILSATVGGSVADGPRRLLDFVRDTGGRAEGTILVHGDRVPLPDAACVNSAMARGFDFDETCEGGGHVSATVVPAALAVAELSSRFKGKAVNGRDFIAAVAFAIEMTCRLRLAGGQGTGFTSGWLAEPFACLAVAAGGGKLLGFTTKQLHYALGIAYFQCFGNLGGSSGEDGGLMAALGQGLATRAGVLSVLLADRGFTATKDIIDGKFGLYSMYGDGGYDPAILVGGLGKRFDLTKTTIKPYPGCAATTAPIYGSLEIAREHAIRPEDVTRVILRVGAYTYNVCGEGKAEPSNAIDALWNYRYSTAVALVKGGVSIGDFTEEAIRDPRVLEVLRKVTVEVDPGKSETKDVDIEIQTRDGGSYRRSVDQPRGHFLNAMSTEELAEKFRSCNRFSAKPLAPERVEMLLQTVARLEELDDVMHLVTMLA